MTTGNDETRREVLAVAAGAGFAVSEAQLARWHRAGLLPRPRQQALGRGRGTATVYPAQTAAQLVALCRIKSETRSLEVIAFQLWWEGFPVDVDRVRPAVRTAAAQLDAELRAGPGADDRSHRASLSGRLSRHLGRQRIHDITEGIFAAAQELPDTLHAIDDVGAFPPSFDDMARRTVPLAGHLVARAPAVEVVADAADGELIAARNKANNFLALLRDWAGLLAWLFGRRGQAFRLFAEMEQHLEPADLPGLVLVLLMMERFLPPRALDFLSDPPATPPLLGQLQTLRALREQVPGASEVLTPAAIRALLRDKEASRRHTPRIEQFIDAHRDEIARVLASLDVAHTTSPQPIDRSVASGNDRFL